MSCFIKKGLCISFLACCFLLNADTLFAKEDIKVAVLKSQELEQYQLAIDGFVRELKRAVSTVEAADFTISNGYTEFKLFNDIAKSSPDIILAVGTEAAQFCSRKFKDVPVVFCMVLDPEENNLAASTNITGISLNIPFESHLQTMSEIVPSLRSVGLLYNPKFNAHNVRKAQAAAATLGITLKSEKVYSREEIVTAFSKLIDTVDAMWIIADPTVSNAYSIKYLLLNTMKKSIPLVGISSQYVKAGALLALVPDYYDIGIQAAQVAAKIVKDGVSAGSIAIAAPRKQNLILNMKTASLINLEIPSYIEARAEEVFR